MYPAGAEVVLACALDSYPAFVRVGSRLWREGVLPRPVLSENETPPSLDRMTKPMSHPARKG